MTNKRDHIDILKRYQAWRKGEDERTMDDVGINPGDITKAINAAMEEITTLRIANSRYEKLRKLNPRQFMALWNENIKGHKMETLPLSVREWTCPECRSVHDRDVNAAINLKNLAVSSTVSACGEEGSGVALFGNAKPASVKQESSSKATYG